VPRAQHLYELHEARPRARPAPCASQRRSPPARSAPFVDTRRATPVIAEWPTTAAPVSRSRRRSRRRGAESCAELAARRAASRSRLSACRFHECVRFAGRDRSRTRARASLVVARDDLPCDHARADRRAVLGPPSVTRVFLYCQVVPLERHGESSDSARRGVPSRVRFYTVESCRVGSGVFPRAHVSMIADRVG
jgi:hypothetical protein